MKLTAAALFLSTILATPAAWCAQEAKEAPTQAPVSRIVQVKHRNVMDLVRVLGNFGAYLNQSQELGVIGVTGKPEIVAAVEEAIKRLDVPSPPPKNIELTVYPIVGLAQASQAGSVPQELESVTRQLKGLFPYQAFRVLDTMVIRCRDGQGGEASGVGAAPEGISEPSARTIYQFRFGKASVSTDGKINVIRLDGLKLGARVPIVKGTGPGLGVGQYQYIDTGFNTDIDVREGQKVVVGKANIDSSNNAMIMVVTARVVD